MPACSCFTAVSVKRLRSGLSALRTMVLFLVQHEHVAMLFGLLCSLFVWREAKVEGDVGA